MAPTPPNVIILNLYKTSVKSVEPSSEVIEQDQMVIDEPEQEPTYDWMHPIKKFLENHLLLDHNVEFERIAHKFKQYGLIDGILFRRGTNSMMKKCISIDEGIQLLQDIHSSICGSHSSWHSIIVKASRHGFY
jgi:hypothetical protein